MRALALLAIMLGSAQVIAGDSWLILQRDPHACGEHHATARASPLEAADDLRSVFQGQEPRIPDLRGIVMNAHIGFCTREDRLEFERALADIGTQSRLVHERKYTDLALMLATESLLTEINGRLARPELAPGARKRLEFLRDEAPRWIEFRRTGRWPPRSTR